MHARSMWFPWLTVLVGINLIMPPVMAFETTPPETRPPVVTDPVPGAGFPRPRPVPAPPVPTTPSSISYQVKPNGTVAITFLNVDVEAAKADLKMKDSVASLLTAYEKNRLVEEQVYIDANASSGWYPGKDAILDVADDERMLADMKAEAVFYDQVAYLLNSAGIGAVGAYAAYLAKQLAETQGLPQGRLAFVLTTVAAAAAKGTVKVVEDKKKSLDSEIAELQQSIDDRFNYLLWAAEYGGDTSDGGRKPPTCIYKTSCVETKVCVRSGLFGEENCKFKDVCGTELLTCRSE